MASSHLHNAETTWTRPRPVSRLRWAPPPRASKTLLDSHGVTTAGTYDRTFLAVIEQVRSDEAAVRVPGTAPAETLQGSIARAVQHALSRLELAPILAGDWRNAAKLMDATGIGGPPWTRSLPRSPVVTPGQS